MAFFSSKQTIGQETLIVRKNELLFNEIDGEMVMMSIENSEYYGMDKVGSRIWQLIDKPIRFSELVEKLLEEFDVAKEQCYEDTLQFMDMLAEKKLISLD